MGSSTGSPAEGIYRTSTRMREVQTFTPRHEQPRKISEFVLLSCLTGLFRPETLIESGVGAGSGNRTRIANLEGWSFTTKLYPRLLGNY